MAITIAVSDSEMVVIRQTALARLDKGGRIGGLQDSNDPRENQCNRFDDQDFENKGKIIQRLITLNQMRDAEE